MKVIAAPAQLEATARLLQETILAERALTRTARARETARQLLRDLALQMELQQGQIIVQLVSTL